MRLPPELAIDLEIIARVENKPVSVIFRDAVANIIAEYKGDADFQARLKEQQEVEKASFRRLGS